VGVFDLLCVGEAFDDLIFHNLPHLPKAGRELKTDAFLHTAGGGALITAVGAARLGLTVALASAVGPRGVAALGEEGVTLRNLMEPGEAAAVTVALSTPRDRSFVTFNGVNRRLEPRLLDAAAGIPARHVHVALSPTRTRSWISRLRELNARAVTTSWDFGWNEHLRSDRWFRPLLASLDIVFLNEPEARFYAGTTTIREARAFWRKTSRGAVIKRGARGSEWIAAGAWVRAPARPATPVDTTGAGDAFNAGYLAGLIDGLEPAACLDLGNRVGAASVGHPGGLTGLPRWDAARRARRLAGTR
jgi:sugar/nucleoside kinase (ribokinase family)